MARFVLGFTCTLIVSITIGCGSGTPVADNPAAPGQQSNDSTGSNQSPAITSPPPTDIVSQFLDEIRRGGEDSRANSLLTARAQSELNRIGQTIQPIGSPNASFKVTRYELHPQDDTAAMVHSIWSEPDAEGGSIASSQVVWGSGRRKMAGESVVWRSRSIPRRRILWSSISRMERKWRPCFPSQLQTIQKFHRRQPHPTRLSNADLKRRSVFPFLFATGDILAFLQIKGVINTLFWFFPRVADSIHLRYRCQRSG